MSKGTIAPNSEFSKDSVTAGRASAHSARAGGRPAASPRGPARGADTVPGGSEGRWASRPFPGPYSNNPCSPRAHSRPQPIRGQAGPCAPLPSGARTPRRGARTRALPTHLLLLSPPPPSPLPASGLPPPCPLPPPSRGSGGRRVNGTYPAADRGRRVGRGRLAELLRPCRQRREKVRRGRPPRGRRADGRPGATGRAGGVGARLSLVWVEEGARPGMGCKRTSG